MKRVALAVCAAALLLFAGAACGEETEKWTDFRVHVDGAGYALPAEFGDFEADGWVLDEEDEMLQPNQYAIVRLKKGEEVISVRVVNLFIDDMRMRQCLVGGVMLDNYNAKKGAVLSVAGFALGDHKDQLLAAWGEPSRTFDGSSRGSLTYETGNYQVVEVGFDSENGAIVDLAMTYMQTPAGYNDAAYAAAVEIPESVTSYTAPEALGDNPLDFTFMLGGVVYRLPVPVSVMAANGWALNGTEYAPKLPAHASDFGWKLQNGAQSLENVGVYNDSARANTWGNGMVIQYRASGFAPVAIELPGGITLDTKMSALEAAWAGAAYSKEASGSFTYYELEENKNSFRSVTVVFDTEKDWIQSIEVQCWPE